MKSDRPMDRLSYRDERILKICPPIFFILTTLTTSENIDLDLEMDRRTDGPMDAEPGGRTDGGMDRHQTNKGTD